MTDFLSSPGDGGLGSAFEILARENGFTWWYYSDLLKLLGYETLTSGPLKKAMQACIALDIPLEESFVGVDRLVDGKAYRDHKLSRFACYLTALNADSKKPQVAAVQVYFVSIANTLAHYLEASEGVERVLIREEVSDRERSIAGVARSHGVVNYAFFQSAGYRGLYNRSLADLRRLKGMEKGSRSLLDFMGKEELAANLFRITQTEAKIKNEGIIGQGPLEVAAEDVGREVRETMRRTSGQVPEDLPLAEDIRDVKKKFKGTAKQMKAIDGHK